MRNFLLGCFVASAFWLAYHGSAQDWIDMNGLAKHLDGREHCNSVTTGLGVEHSQSRDWRAVGGFYRNSNCRWSTYAAEAWTPLHLGSASLGVIAGAVTGYRTSPLPAGGLVAAIEGEKMGLNILLIPPVGDSGNVLWLQAKVRW